MTDQYYEMRNRPLSKGERDELRGIDTNDAGLADALTLLFGDRVKYVPEDRSWAGWNGRQWLRGDAGYRQAVLYAHAVPHLLREAGFPDEKFLSNAGNVGRIGGMLALACPRLMVGADKFDAVPNSFFCRNGGVVLKKLREECVVARDSRQRSAVCLALSELVSSGAKHRFGPWGVSACSADRFEIEHDGEGVIETIDREQLSRGISRGTHRLELAGRYCWYEFEEHRPENFNTRAVDYDHDASAVAEAFTGFIQSAFADDHLACFQRALGYFLFGFGAERRLFMLAGGDYDRRQLIFHSLHQVFGEYAISTNPGMWVTTRLRAAAEPSPELVAFASDVRLGTCPDVPSRMLSSERVQPIVSQHVISARKLYGPQLEFTPHVSLLFGVDDPAEIWIDTPQLRNCTTVFQVRGGDFDYTAIPRLVSAIRDERAGILNFALAGGLAWLRQSVAPPATTAFVSRQVGPPAGRSRKRSK